LVWRKGSKCKKIGGSCVLARANASGVLAGAITSDVLARAITSDEVIALAD
jgi:hypothetical protein